MQLGLEEPEASSQVVEENHRDGHLDERLRLVIEVAEDAQWASFAAELFDLKDSEELQ